MERFIIYQGKVAIAIAAFYMLYLLLFSKRKQFPFNRIYLSGSILISFIIPLLTFTISAPGPAYVLLPEAGGSRFNTETAVTGQGMELTGMLFVLYIVVTFIFLGIFLAGHLKVIAILKNSGRKTVNGRRILVTEKDVQPFTYLNKIVVPSHALSHPDLTMILDHESVHATDNHFFDILLSEIMFFSQWFNPFAWLQRRAVKNNLEYLTDQKISTSGNMQQYQLAMVSLAGKQEVAPFLNNLSGNNLKTRIIMMKKKTENRNNFVRRLAILPLLAVLIPGLSSREYKVLPSGSPNPTINEVIMNRLKEPSSDTLANKKKEVVVIGYALPKDSVRKKGSATKKDSVVVISFHSPLDHNSWKLTPAATENTKDKEVTVIGYKSPVDGKIQLADTLRIRSTGQPGGDPLYILDGKEIKSIEGIQPDKIESISVLKDQSATTLYGEKGKNGVILITSKKTGNPADNVLIILDGKETSKKVADINPEEIQSVNVLKGDHAVSQYGEKGKNGVIEITLKKSPDAVPETVTTVDQLRKSIARSIRYPRKAIENGDEGSVKIYAFVNSEGEITQISESNPGTGTLNVNEVVVVGYGPENVQKKTNDNNPVLMEEAALTVKKLPALDIADFKGKWVEFSFKFLLQ